MLTLLEHCHAIEEGAERHNLHRVMKPLLAFVWLRSPGELGDRDARMAAAMGRDTVDEPKGKTRTAGPKTPTEPTKSKVTPAALVNQLVETNPALRPLAL